MDRIPPFFFLKTFLMNPDYCFITNKDEQKRNRKTDGSSMMEIERTDRSEYGQGIHFK